VRGKKVADCTSEGFADLVRLVLNYGKLPRDIARLFEINHL
jgi:hypothetical protein